MNILLLYPKSVEGEYRRETRLEHQIACISQLIRKVLGNAVIEQSFTVREIAYETNSANESAGESWKPASEIFEGKELQAFSADELLLLYKNANLVIEVCGDKKTQTDFYRYDGASITIRPTYPGSFAQNDINIECRNIEEKSWITEKVIAATEQAEKIAKVDEYVDPDMFYSQFAPLPVRLSDEFYSRQRDHALVFLSFTAGEDNAAICESDQQTLSLLLHDMESLRSLTIVTDTLKTAPKVEKIAESLKDALAVDTRVFAHRRGDYRDLFSVLSKCDMALFAGSSLYVDSLRLGVPVYVWRAHQTGVQPLNDAFLSLSENYDLSAVLEQQRNVLENFVQSHYLGHTLPNNSRILIDSVAGAIEKVAPGIVIDTAKLMSESLIPEPVIDQPRVWHDDSITRRLKNSLSRGRKKFTKLRQNPNRFLQDSDHPLAQKIYTLMR